MTESEIRAEALELLRQFHTSSRHVKYVADLALRLFDQLQVLHGLGDRDRFLLEIAGYLHDLGSEAAPAGKEHHKVSAQLIREHPWRGISPIEAEVVAQVARYHRRSVPKASHEEFTALAPNDQQRVRQLAALLRIADGLDSEHTQFVTGIRTVILPELILLEVTASTDPTYELAAADKKADLARMVFGRAIRLAWVGP
jgi:exopolyphosphatase / guanosine-5'-triphosphate,3'-diphosphate pyrophosphatase